MTPNEKMLAYLKNPNNITPAFAALVLSTMSDCLNVLNEGDGQLTEEEQNQLDHLKRVINVDLGLDPLPDEDLRTCGYFPYKAEDNTQE